MAVRRTITSAAPFASSSMGYLDSHPLFLYTTYRAIPIFVRVKNCTAQAPARHRTSRIVADIYAAFFIIIFPFTFNKRWLNQDATLIFINHYFFALSVDSSPTVVNWQLLSAGSPTCTGREASICHWYHPPSYTVILVIPFS